MIIFTTGTASSICEEAVCTYLTNCDILYYVYHKLEVSTIDLNKCTITKIFEENFTFPLIHFQE